MKMTERAKKTLTERLKTQAAWIRFGIHRLAMEAETASMAFKGCIKAMGNLKIKE
jgi:hypothetical protein